MSDFLFCLASCFFVVFAYFVGVRFGKTQGYLSGYKAGFDEAANLSNKLHEGRYD